MFKFYWIFLNDKYLCCEKALSEKSAIDQAYMKHGSASKYTGQNRSAFRAELLSLT